MNGLSKEEVETRIKDNLINKKINYSRKTKDIIFKNVFTLFNFINIVLFILVLTTKSYKNGLFAFVIVINTIISIYSEIKAKIIINKLNIMNESKITVIRDGIAKEISQYEIVLDDIISLKSGDVVPTDIVVVNSNMCEVDESIITGEDKNIIKKKGDTIFSGSIIVSGNLKARVINVGKNNYANRLIKEASYIKEDQTYLKKELNKVLKIITILIIPMTILLFVVQFFINKQTYNEAILYTTAGVIGMIPSGLILLTSVALSTGVINLGKKKVIVQKTSGIESLSCIDTLCLDKTGTITKGTMSVVKVINLSKLNIDNIIKNMVINSQINQTDIALNEYFNLTEKLKAIKTVPFSSYRKYSMAEFENIGTFGLGAREYMMNKSYEENDEVKKYLSEGYRVVTLVHSKKYSDTQKLPDDIKIVGYIILKDNLRDNISKTLNYFEKQGVDLRIISGDNVESVSKIMKLASYKNYDNYLDCSSVTDEELIAKAESHAIFGRCNPYQKKLIIKTLQNKHTVGMVGDGINDILALKEADCSIALNSNSNAAKSVSQIVLLQNDFSVLPNIVEEGRRVINNIERVASLYLIKTVYSFILSLLTIIFRKDYPFYPIQLTLIGSVCVGLPSFFLTMLKDSRKVSKDFIKNAFRSAVSGGIIITLNIIIITIISIITKKNISDYSTLIVASTGLVNLYILYQISKPINNKRMTILILACIIFGTILVFFDNLFILNKINIIILLMLTSFFGIDIILINFLENIYDRMILWMQKKELKN